MGKTSVAHANFLVRVKIMVMGERSRVFLEIVPQHHPDFALESFPLYSHFANSLQIILCYKKICLFMRELPASLCLAFLHDVLQ